MTARRWLFFLSAALAAVLTAVMLPLSSASAQTAPAAGTRVGASHPGMIFTVGVSHSVSAGEGRCDSLSRAGFASGLCVAAEDGGSVAEEADGSALRHYTTSDAADAISKDGSIKPGISSGKIWVTPDEYASGAEAQAKLALSRTPEGYYEFPATRVINPSAPSTVDPYYGQPGGGVEITTELPIDVTDIPFVPFP